MAEDKFMGLWETFGAYDNWEELMKELGVNWFTRKAAKNATVYGNLEKDGDVIDYKWKLSIKSGHSRFRLGEEFDEYTPDGRPVKSKMWVEDGKLMAVQCGEPADTHIERSIDEEGNMVERLTVNKVVCTKIYKPSDVVL